MVTGMVTEQVDLAVSSSLRRQVLLDVLDEFATVAGNDKLRLGEIVAFKDRLADTTAVVRRLTSGGALVAGRCSQATNCSKSRLADVMSPPLSRCLVSPSDHLTAQLELAVAKLKHYKGHVRNKQQLWAGAPNSKTCARWSGLPPRVSAPADIRRQ